jgi:hypothetical protein
MDVLNAIQRRFEQTDANADQENTRFFFRVLNLVHEARPVLTGWHGKRKTAEKLKNYDFADEASVVLAGGSWRRALFGAKDLIAYTVALRAMTGDTLVTDCVSRCYWHARNENAKLASTNVNNAYIDLNAEEKYKRLSDFTVQFPTVFQKCSTLLDALWTAVHNRIPSSEIMSALRDMPCEPGYVNAQSRRAQLVGQNANIIINETVDDFCA